MIDKKIIENRISETSNLINSLTSLSDKIIDAIELIHNQISKGGTVYWCGNGGSAADSQHMAAELMGKLNSLRKPIKSIALTTDTSFITAWSNDIHYEDIFSRQLEGLAGKNDILVAISTSGKSKNIIKALKTAKDINLPSILLTGLGAPDSTTTLSDIVISVNSSKTPVIQESFLIIEHIICENIDQFFSDKTNLNE